MANSGFCEEFSNQPPAPAFHRTRMCRFHILGACNRGSFCLFAHSADALQPQPDFTCTQVCPSLIDEGFCNRAQCLFAHSKEELRHRPRTDNEVKSHRRHRRRGSQKKSAWPLSLEVPRMVVARRLRAEEEEKQSSSFGSTTHPRDGNKNEFVACWKQQQMHGSEATAAYHSKSTQTDAEMQRNRLRQKESVSSQSLVKALEIFSVPVQHAEDMIKFEQRTHNWRSDEDLDGNFNDDDYDDGLLSADTSQDSQVWPIFEEAEMRGKDVTNKYSKELVAGDLWQQKMPEIPYYVKNTFIDQIADVPAGSAMKRSSSVPAPVLA